MKSSQYIITEINMLNKLMIVALCLFSSTASFAQLNITSKDALKVKRICSSANYYYIVKTYNDSTVFYTFNVGDVIFGLGKNKETVIKTLQDFAKLKSTMKKGQSYECKDFLNNTYTIEYNSLGVILTQTNVYLVNGFGVKKGHPWCNLWNKSAINTLIDRFISKENN